VVYSYNKTKEMH